MAGFYRKWNQHCGLQGWVQEGALLELDSMFLYRLRIACPSQSKFISDLFDIEKLKVINLNNKIYQINLKESHEEDISVSNPCQNILNFMLYLKSLVEATCIITNIKIYV